MKNYYWIVAVFIGLATVITLTACSQSKDENSTVNASATTSADVGAYLSLAPISGLTKCNLDSIDGKPFAGGPIPLAMGAASFSYEGWGIDLIKKSPAKGVAVTINNKPVDVAHYGDDRPDIEKVYSDPSLLKTGFHGSVNVSDLKPGNYNLALWIMNSEGTGYYVCGSWVLKIQ